MKNTFLVGDWTFRPCMVNFCFSHHCLCWILRAQFELPMMRFRCLRNKPTCWPTVGCCCWCSWREWAWAKWGWGFWRRTIVQRTVKCEISYQPISILLSEWEIKNTFLVKWFWINRTNGWYWLFLNARYVYKVLNFN
jgi:hypothetical protein